MLTRDECVTVRDLNPQWSASNTTGLIVEIVFAAGCGDVILSVGMLFNASTSASEVRLVGNSATLSFDLESRPPGNGSPRLLTMSRGAPPVSLHNLTLRGALAVDGGLLKMFDCAVEENSDAASNGGALLLTGGRVEATRTAFARNTARNGGAVYVDGGTATFANCTLTENTATHQGGALHVHRGSVVLRDHTLLSSNFARSTGEDRGDSIFTSNASHAEYQTPCPLGRWIVPDSSCPIRTDGPDASSYASMRLLGHTNLDFPYECAPGYYGSSDGCREQTTPFCTGPCAEGQYCLAGTVIPQK